MKNCMTVNLSYHLPVTKITYSWTPPVDVIRDGGAQKFADTEKMTEKATTEKDGNSQWPKIRDSRSLRTIDLVWIVPF